MEQSILFQYVKPFPRGSRVWQTDHLLVTDGRTFS